ncbi:MAG TPA: hypothetical protein VM869_31895, partial [Enhygromyxa sp.]|nr:hypothetical protein [Enhygromyxa sp.]
FAPDGTIVVTGTHWIVGDPSNHPDLWTRKYSAAGSPLWTQSFDAGDLDPDEGWGVDVNDLGELLTVGYMTLGGDQKIVARKYAP